MNYRALFKILLIILFALLQDVATAQDTNQQLKKPSSDAPVFLSPDAFVQQNLLSFEESLKELTKKYETTCGLVIMQNKLDTESKAVKSLVASVPKFKSVVFTIDPYPWIPSFDARIGFGNIKLVGRGHRDYFFVSRDLSNIFKLNQDYFKIMPGAYVTFKVMQINEKGDEISGGLYQLPLTSEISGEPGPFIPSDETSVAYIGGKGQSTIKWTSPVSNHSYQETLTANAVDVELDPAMLDKEVASAGKYTVKIIVYGPADMSRFSLNWSIEGPAKWQHASTGFTKQADRWVSTNILEVNSTSEIKPNTQRQKISFKAILPASERANGFTFSGSVVKGNVPPAEQLILMTKYGNTPPVKFTTIDLFYPNAKKQDIKLMPYVKLKGIKEPIYIADLPVPISVEFESKNPNAADVGLQGNIITKSIYSDEGEIIAKITGRLGADKQQYVELADGKSKLTDKVFVNVNVLLLSSQTNKDGKTEYTLFVSGPTDMSKYTVRWIEKAFLGTNTHNTQFSTDGQAYVSKLTVAFKIASVQIIKGDKVVAELTSSSDVISQAATVTLLPSSPPTTIVKKIESDKDFASLSECISEVSRWMDMWGFEPGKSPEGYCKDKMQAQAKSAQLAQAQNQYIKELNAKGYELVTFSDEMKVGALVLGLKKEYTNRTVCKWYLKTATKLYLETDTTPVQTDNVGIGGCFNKVKGIKEHFDPTAEISVELVLDTQMPNYPLFIQSNTIQLFSNMLGR